MILRTELSIPPSANKMEHLDEIMTFGSCFSHHIGHRLQKYKFKCICNPFGTVFNPISISRLIRYVCLNHQVDTTSLLKSQGLWVHPDFHSMLSHSDQKTAAENINNKIANIHSQLKTLKHLFITLGTSWAYKQKSNDQIVTNCHKIAASSFIKVNIGIDEGFQALSDAFETLRKINPNLLIIITVSPVRHIKDGIVENSLSKARLHAISEKLLTKFENVTYFPAYEWMIDDLRDYRYYEADMIHPNPIAIDYIWGKFADYYFTENIKQLNKKIDSILQAAQHKPFNPSSVANLLSTSCMETPINAR